MKHNPKVSIVIPTYNRSHYLDQCIKTALEQTLPCEIVVCDHGSTDNTSEVARKYEGKIKYIRKDTDFGVHFCWLDGIINATGEYIHINYDDDWIEPTFIEKCMALFDNTTSFVFSDVVLFNDDLQTFTEAKFKPFFKKTGSFSRSRLWLFELKNLISPGCAIFRKKNLLDHLYIGSIPFTINEYKGVGPDLLFSLMATIDYKKVGFVAEPLAVFRSHASSITIDAHQNIFKQQKIRNAYDDARVYFMITNIIRIFAIRRLCRFILKGNVVIYNVLKKLKKINK